MKIEIISVNAMSEGAEMLLTLQISDNAGNKEKRKLLIFTNQYLELSLRKGMILDEERYDALEKCSKECIAIRKGSNLLSYSSSSRSRLVQRLRSKGIDKESAESAASHLANMGAINEELDTEREVEACLRKLWGKNRIYQDLVAKGYQKEYIENALSGITKEQMMKNCMLLLKKKHRTIPDDPAIRKKIAGSLARYGYTFDEIRYALGAMVKETE